MNPRKKGNQYEIVYRCPGFQKPFCERFETLEEANLRIAQIEEQKKLGNLKPSSKLLYGKNYRAPNRQITVRELMEEYVSLYGLNHWGDSFLSANRHRIDHYINPYIGDCYIRYLTTYDLDHFYDHLRSERAVVLKGHRDTEKKIGFSVIEKVHSLLRSAFNQAIRWGYLEKNPADYATLPRHKNKQRDAWTPEEAYHALSVCEHPTLKLCMLLAIGCSMRIGEILGLTWDCIEISPARIEQQTAVLHITKELKRCENKSLLELEKRGALNDYYRFPHQKSTPASTTLVLKPPKTDSSVRDIFLPNTVAQAILDHRQRQLEEKELLGPEYTDFNLVAAQINGFPVEARYISKLLQQLIRDHQLKPVVFHSLRHSSVSLKLSMGGDIKAVQGDTGHAQANMVTDLYAHINCRDRQRLAALVDQNYFCRQPAQPESKPQASASPALSPEILRIAEMLEHHKDMQAALLPMLELRHDRSRTG